MNADLTRVVGIPWNKTMLCFHLAHPKRTLVNRVGLPPTCKRPETHGA